MHFDTRLVLLSLLLPFLQLCFASISTVNTDEQTYLSLVEFHRGGESSNLIITSPHGGFLGANLTSNKGSKSISKENLMESLIQLPLGGCYNNTLDRCVYVYRDCLRDDQENKGQVSFYPDGRCMLDRTSTPTMYRLTKAIAEAFPSRFRPYTILNKLSRQYVDPAEDLLVGTFLIESATRVYIDYHRLIAMSKEATRPATRGLFIEFVSHRNSQAVQLGYGFESSRTSVLSKPSLSTMVELFSRSGPSIMRGNRSLSFFLRQNGFREVIPSDMMNQQQQHVPRYRISTHSTRAHADQRFNSILFSYPIERLRSRPLKQEAAAIAKAIEQFMRINQIQAFSSLSSSRTLNPLLLFSLLCLSSSLSTMSIY